MDKLAEYINSEDVGGRLREEAEALGITEFARVRNLDYVYAPYEFCPLAPHVEPPLPRIVAFAVDMDGTSTTTEPLALHALEYMVRRFTGLLTPADWPGLDRQRDYPHVIGNSNFRHTEFLIERYRDRVNLAALRQAFIEAVCWTFANLPDPQRRREVALTARNCGLAELLADADFRRLTQEPKVEADDVGRLVAPFVTRFGPAFHCAHTGDVVSAALDVYYFCYHAILQRIERGEGKQLRRELPALGNRRLIEPMPGYEVFLPLIKGWLGVDLAQFYGELSERLPKQPDTDCIRARPEASRARLSRLGAYFQRHPAKLALVTASIAFEAHTVMREVIRVVADRIQTAPLPSACRDRVAARLTDYRSVYDGFVNASDACEPRLKPHRDLYSLALHQMSVPRDDYACCVGLEDTEPGIVALRAAGIGCAIALPNRDTSLQDYAAATRVVRAGLPELILVHNLLLADRTAAAGPT